MKIIQKRTVADLPIKSLPGVEILRNRSLAFTLRKMLREKAMAAPVFEYTSTVEQTVDIVRNRFLYYAMGKGRRSFRRSSSSSSSSRSSKGSRVSENSVFRDDVDYSNTTIFDEFSAMVTGPPRKRYVGVVDVRDVIILLLNENESWSEKWWKAPLVQSFIMANRGVEQAINLGGYNEPSKVFVSKNTQLIKVFDAFTSAGALQVFIVENHQVCGIITQHDFFEYVWQLFSQLKDTYKVKKYLDTSIYDLQLIQPNIVAVNERATLRDALSLMTDRQVGAIPVTDDDGVMTGVLSVSDIKQLYTSVENRLLETLNLDEIIDVHKLDMPVKLFVERQARRTSSHWESLLCKETDSLMNTIHKLLSPQAQRVFVLDDVGRPCGVTTLTDIMCMLRTWDPKPLNRSSLSRWRTKRPSLTSTWISKDEITRDVRALFAGYLAKRGKLVKSWKTRLFVLRNIDGELELSYYAKLDSKTSPKGQAMFKLKGTIPLGYDFVVRIQDSPTNGKMNAFHLWSRRRSLTLSAFSEKDRQNWTEIFAKLSNAHEDDKPQMPVCVEKKSSKIRRISNEHKGYFRKKKKKGKRLTKSSSEQKAIVPSESGEFEEDDSNHPVLSDSAILRNAERLEAEEQLIRTQMKSFSGNSTSNESSDSTFTVEDDIGFEFTIPEPFNGRWQMDMKRSDTSYNEVFGKLLGTPWAVRMATAKKIPKRTIDGTGIRWTQSTSVAGFTFNSVMHLDGREVVERHPFDGSSVRVRHKLSSDGSVNSVAWYEKQKIRHDIQRKLLDDNTIQFFEAISPSELPSLDDMEPDQTFRDDQHTATLYYYRIPEKTKSKKSKK